jgi:hypothetical protein
MPVWVHQEPTAARAPSRFRLPLNPGVPASAADTGRKSAAERAAREKWRKAGFMVFG